MPDQVAMNVAEDALVETTLPRPFSVRCARAVSNILSPAAISGPCILGVALYRASSLLAALAYACVTIFFLSFGPFVYILLGVRLGKLSDVDVSRRSERTEPFLFALVSMSVGLLVLVYLHGPKNLETVMISTALSGAMLMVTTLWWKISIHASSLAGAVTLLTALFGSVMLPAFLLVALVSWSRVVLRRHTVAQVVAGSLAGSIMAALILLVRSI